MQIRFAALFAIIVYLCKSVQGDIISTLCRSWQCQSGVGQGQSATARPCSVSNITQQNATVGVEACQPSGYICDAPYSFIKNETCYQYNVLKWKRTLPAGDSCTSNAECWSGACNKTGSSQTCSGVGFTGKCKIDNDCYPGLFCNSTQFWDNVIKVGSICSATNKCQFGSLCANGTWVRNGAYDVGKQFYVNGTMPAAVGTMVSVSIMRACKTFWAEYTGNATNDNNKYGIFECTKGRDLVGNTYGRGIGASNICLYNFTFANGTEKGATEPAQCGYNSDGLYYCPQRRSQKDYKDLNAVDVVTWNEFTNVECNVNTTIQYCRGIEDNAIYSLGYRSAILNEMKTQNFYPLIANNDRCVGDAIETTKNYYRVIDSAYGTMLTYFALVAGFFTLVLLY